MDRDQNKEFEKIYSKFSVMNLKNICDYISVVNNESLDA